MNVSTGTLLWTKVEYIYLCTWAREYLKSSQKAQSFGYLQGVLSILDEKFLQIQNVITLHCFLNSGTSVLLGVLFLISIFYSVILFRRGLGISYLSVFKKGGKDCSYLENNILCKILSSLMSGIWKNLEEIMKIVNFHGQT